MTLCLFLLEFMDHYGSVTIQRWDTSDGKNLYVTNYNSHIISKVVIATGATTTVAGVFGTSGSADGNGSTARFNNPEGITTIDGTTLYVADWGSNTIRKIDTTTGAVTTIAGTAGASGLVDGIGTSARFNKPHGITTDGTSLFVSDNFNNAIRVIDLDTLNVTTLVTSGINGTGIVTDGTYLYVADWTQCTIKQVEIATGTVTLIAGLANNAGFSDGIGTTARFNIPQGVTTDGTNLYVADTGNEVIRKIVIATGEVTTIAGSSGLTGATDGVGSDARFSNPFGLTSDGTNLYVAEEGNGNLRMIK